MVRRWLARRHPERKALLVVACAVITLLAVSSILTVGEIAPDRADFRAGADYEVPLQYWESAAVYRTAYDRDLYGVDSSDLACALVDPNGEEVVGRRRDSPGRALDGWTRHAEVVSWRATTSGTHRLTCTDRWDGTHEMTFVRGEPWWQSPLVPETVAVRAMLYIGPIWLFTLMLSLLLRGASRLDARRRSTADDDGVLVP